MPETRIIFQPRTPLLEPPPRVFSRVGRVNAQLTSLDTGLTLPFLIPPSEHDRDFGSDWVQAEVAQAAVDFIEYKGTPPEKRVYKVTFNAYIRAGGVANDIEAEYKALKSFVTTAPPPRRAHKLLFTQGVQRFRCVLTRVGKTVWRIARNGGALIALDTSIELMELR